MITKVIRLDRSDLKPEDFILAADLIKNGKLVAFPTETVYGLGADALNVDAIRKIYEAKGRPCDNPLIVHIAELGDMAKVARDVPTKAYMLAERFWPGPLTMILGKNSQIPPGITGGLDTVAVRMPSDVIARMLIRESSCLIAAPSANTSGSPSATSAGHVIEDLDGRIDLVLDGGFSCIGLESTIIDLTTRIPMILRPGYITKEELEDAIGEVVYDGAIGRRHVDLEDGDAYSEVAGSQHVDLEDGDACSEAIGRQHVDPEDESSYGGLVAKAPGMKYRHYAPKADIIIYEGNKEDVANAINTEVRRQEAMGSKAGVLCTDETRQLYDGGTIRSIGSRTDEDTIAARLFSLLRGFDELGVSCVYSESFYELRLGFAIMNRLSKASGHRVVRL